MGYFSFVEWNEDAQAVTGLFNPKPSRIIIDAMRSHLGNLCGNDEIELSIVGAGHSEIEKFNNEFVAKVLSLENIYSIDPCRSGNAGGKITSLAECKSSMKNSLDSLSLQRIEVMLQEWKVVRDEVYGLWNKRVK